VHNFYKMFVKDIYSQTRHVSVHVGSIIRGSIEEKTLVVKHERVRRMPCISSFT
jgi:hypothetical protein